MAEWKNWAETVELTGLEKAYRPRSLDELVSNVEEAARKGWKLRAVGSGHAWSNLGAPRRCNGAVVLTDKLNKTRGIAHHGHGIVVNVEGGITVERLTKWLFRNGYALENMGDANPQSIAGAVSTETHGSGVNLGSLSEFIDGMTVVTVDQSKSAQVIDLVDGAKPYLKAGRLSLGKLGVVYSIRLRVRENYHLKHHQQLVKFEEERGLLDDLLKNRHLEYWLYPYTGMAERITREETTSTEEINRLDLLEEWFIKIGAGIVERKGKDDPASLPKFFQDNVKKGARGFRDIERQGPWHKILLGKSNVWRDRVRTYTMEYQFPLGKLWEAYTALEESIELARRKCVYVASPTQVRFTKRSSGSLLTHMRFQPTVSFSISFFRKHKGAHTWLPELEKRLLDLDGRPHWGKMYYTQPEANAAFEEIRRELDPHGVFSFEQGPYRPDPEAFQGP